MREEGGTEAEQRQNRGRITFVLPVYYREGPPVLSLFAPSSPCDGSGSRTQRCAHANELVVLQILFSQY